jgi:SAM-dependent methyltransferase
MDAEIARYTAANRAAWNEVQPLHQRANRERWDRAFQQPGYSCLAEEELATWRRIGLAGSDVAQLACNNGVELLSLRNLGAGRCLGFDIADEAIAEARARASLCAIDCSFVRTDVYELDAAYNGQFDVVYMTAGCLGWMPHLPAFFARAAALLRRGGRVLLHEIHPFAEMLPEDAAGGDCLRLASPYFKAEPYEDIGGLDYVGRTAYAATTRQYWFVHTLSDIVMALLAVGLAIEEFREVERDISAVHARAAAARAGIPLSMILVARLSAAGPALAAEAGQP